MDNTQAERTGVGWTAEREMQLTSPASALCIQGFMCCKFTLKYKECLCYYAQIG